LTKRSLALNDAYLLAVRRNSATSSKRRIWVDLSLFPFLGELHHGFHILEIGQAAQGASRSP
jgi:hypothetical protein